MALPPPDSSQTTSTPVPPGSNQQARRRRRVRLALTGIVAGCAVLAPVIWQPIMVSIAQTLRPPDKPHVDFHTLASEASAHMSIIMAATILAQLALAALAIYLGRGALHVPSDDVLLRRLEKWAIGSLVIGVAVGLGPTLVPWVLRFSTFFQGSEPLYTVMMAGAMGSFVLSGITIHNVPPASFGQAPAQGRVWQYGVRISLAVASLVVIAWFWSVYFVCLFIINFFLVGFFLHSPI
ncbi:MAG: hypothetical protein ACLQUY_27150 [Ktedonobacterales bacterium]